MGPALIRGLTVQFVALARELDIAPVTPGPGVLEEFPETAVAPARFAGDRSPGVGGRRRRRRA
jgi:hypothetical protein